MTTPSAAATPETTGRSLLMRDARKGPRRPPGKKNATKRTTCTSGTGHCMLCHPPATLESLAWLMRPPGGSPSDSQGDARREISAHPTTGSGFRQPSASTGCMPLRVSPFCVVPRPTASMLPAMRCHTAHMPNHGVSRCCSTSLVGSKKQTAASGIRKAPGSLSKGRRSGALGLAGRWNRTRMARERVACLLRIPETFHMPASSVHAESGPETSQSPARSILARRRLPRSLHQRIRTHAHGGLIVGLFVEQQDLSARFHITCGPRTQARFLLSCRRNGTKSQLCGGRHRTKIRCWSRLARQ